jgi:hypothetical protein
MSLIGVLVATGCKNDENCVKARNAASDSWKQVMLTAGTNKVAPTIGLDELGADQKGAHVEAWGTIEKQAEMIASSFAYEKITWNTADPALSKANNAFDGYFAKDKFKSFDMQLKDANAKYQATAAACRD